jgi:trehalose-phosphatase
MPTAKVSTAVGAAIDRIGTRLDGDPLVLLLDVDGTLAPIAPTPAMAQVPAATRLVLERLSEMDRVTVALVSGRAADDAQRVAGVPGAWVIGNHGYELMTPQGDVSVDPGAASFEKAMANAARQLSSVSLIPGGLIENKRWTLSVHYRNVTRGVETLKSRARAVAAEHGLRVTEGKRVIELRPPVDIDKGTAALEFVRRHGALMEGSAIYAGDDRTDEDAFRALRPGRGAVTIHVGTDTAATTSAELVLPSPVELTELLGWLLTRRLELG